MKQFFFAAFTVLVIATISQTACYYDNEQTLYGGNTCDTTAVSYSTDIRPILDANCISCHAPGGEQETSPLVTYEDMKKYTSDRNVVDRTNGSSSLMPPSGKMSSCNVALIEAWVNDGAPNN
jgi:mono/diheme cytochrome c family protein